MIFKKISNAKNDEKIPVIINISYIVFAKKRPKREKGPGTLDLLAVMFFNRH